MTSSERSSVAEIIAGVEKPASYLAAARQLAALPTRDGHTPVRAFVVSSFTFELAVPYLVVECARRGLDARIACGPYGQLEQQVLEPESELYRHQPEVVIVATRVEDVTSDLAVGFLGLTDAAIDQAIAGYVGRIEQLVRALRARAEARVVVWNQPPLQRIAAGIADPSLRPSQQDAMAEINRRLANTLATVPGAVVFDAARVACELGTARWYDPKLAAMARMPLAASAIIAVSKRLARTLRAMWRPACKCLVLDLDNTLWGGVLGEDGIAGIALGEDHPGSAYKQFQRALRSYRNRGVLLAIASKNNESDVRELFADHPDMVLKRDDFAATEIHWEDKAGSLRRIAESLNIGIDALAFFDDSPVERAWVREQLPEVTVIEVPADPLDYIDALDGAGAFDQLVITTEDRQRADQYRNETERRSLERAAGSLDEFLRSLQMKVTIGRIDCSSIPRVVQLLGKTNQFNVTTRRHTEGVLTQMLSADGAIGLWMRVSDRYGDSGLVGVAIALREAGEYRLDSFLMSCRVLGRQVELALLGAVASRARKAGGSTLVGEFIPTKKNAPAAKFFADAGFSPCPDRPGWWRLELERFADRPLLFEVLEE